MALALTFVLCVLHGTAIWRGLGGSEGLSNGWPIWRDDHPLYYHSALVTRAFLKLTWTTAGYDPRFMAGYAKSVVFPASSTLPELAVALFGGEHPERAFKLYVLFASALVPWLVALACLLWRVSPGGTAVAVLLYLVYVWTDFPIRYAEFGMVPYFLAVPLALVGVGLFARFLERGGALNWWLATAAVSLAFLVHLTSLMVIAPAAALAYALVAQQGRAGRKNDSKPGWFNLARFGSGAPPRSLNAWGHLSVWMIPPVVLAVNSFWWLPGIWLADTKGASDFAFAHPEGVLRRLGQIVWSEAEIEAILLAVGLPGLLLSFRRHAILGVGLLGFAAAGMFWGYLAGEWRALDFLQPGRHTYAFYTALAVASAVVFDELRGWLRGAQGVDHLERFLLVGVFLVGIRVLGHPLYVSICGRLACQLEAQFADLGWLSVPLPDSVRLRFGPGEPFLSSRPSPRLLWVVDRVHRRVKAGERLLYEEGGFGLPGVPDPFQRGRFSGLLAERTRVELIGGPYLHASLQTNFTQFGEGKLCGKPNWNRADFVRYAKLYGPSAILCWSPHARRFCYANTDLIRVQEDDGTVLLGRVLGFEGPFLEGKGRVVSEPGRLQLSELSPGLDGWIVLRYHSVPCLKTRPAVSWEPEYREDDPVPFIRLRPPPGTSQVELEMHFPFGL